MEIWIDADACPKVIKEILFRMADRVQQNITLVANTKLWTPLSQYIKTIQVKEGYDVADKHIVVNMQSGDLVITADIPLAAEVIKKGGFAINPRGEFYTSENVQSYLSIRNFMDDLRSSGVMTGGPAPFNMKDRHAFANQLHRFLEKRPIDVDAAI